MRKLGIPRKNKWEKLVGTTIGRLLILEYFPGFGRLNDEERTRNKVLCRCICGTEKIIDCSSLTSGHANSCGCLQIEKLKNRPLTSEKGSIGFNMVYREYKNRANKKNIKFDLSKEVFKELTTNNCFYCNRPPEQIRKISIERNPASVNNSIYRYNGIDRIDNSLGYFLENCVPCCKICNQAKSALPVSDFKNWIRAAYNHLCAKEDYPEESLLDKIRRKKKG